MQPSSTPNPLLRYFTGLAEFTFEARLGVCDPPLIDYISNLLVRFVANDSIFGVRTEGGQRVTEVAEMLLVAEERPEEERRHIHRHIGDFTLFWSGVYPEALEKRRAQSRHDWILNYREQGKRAYHIASTLRQPEPDLEADVLARLSHDFELCAEGLTEIRRAWEQRDESGSIIWP